MVLSVQVASGIVRLWGHTLRYPSDPAKIKEVEAGFRRNRKMHGASGVTDGMHMEIQLPSKDGDNYICRKKFPSLACQATADSAYRCIDFVGLWPGSVHDSRVFRNSSLRNRITSGNIPLLHMEPIQVWPPIPGELLLVTCFLLLLHTLFL